MADERVNETLLLIAAELPNVRAWPQKVRKMPDPHTKGWVQFGVPGMADISGVAGPGGWRIEIEMKNLKGEHRNKKTIERQKNWRRMIESLGGIYIKAAGERDAVEQLKAVLEEKRK